MLRERGREYVRLAAELGRVRRELQQYSGLPPDAAEARAAIQQKREELERLQERWNRHLRNIQ